ncbi:unnamed protein product [Dracunculus medinensis]|uniref:Abhydro_lipase domain-containing protein n=1 Tax=Dracunculus medinensis TaxID=318479 RepID=A0A0N4UII5_DRAME|nr:unnamed protein product [Dracunculus medinensis]
MLLHIIVFTLLYWNISSENLVKAIELTVLNPAATPNIIDAWGYPLHSVKVKTEDGYILTMHRIPYGKEEMRKPCNARPVVFLQHGLEATSSNFVTNLPNKSLGFLLADNGFDVWMGNVRGNRYSREHVNLTANDKSFWKFSWFDMMKYDLTAMIDKALELTNQSHLYYIGHSQGTLIMFSKLTNEAHFANKIRKFFALAPVATVKHIKGLLALFADNFYWALEVFTLISNYCWYRKTNLLSKTFQKWFGTQEFVLNDTLMDVFKNKFCDSYRLNLACVNLLSMIAGLESGQLNETRLPIFLSDLPGGTSVMNVINWIQMVRNGAVQAYDWENPEENIKHYGQNNPPIFDLKKVDVDMYLYWSPADWLANQKDIEEFLLLNLNMTANFHYKISNSIRDIFNVKLKKFNHMDFLWGERAANEIYKPIIDIIKGDRMVGKTGNS